MCHMAVGHNIKGITIEIGGDTTKLTQALSKANFEIRDTRAQMKDINKLRKLDPGNTELIAQNHKLLGQTVDETKENLKQLASFQTSRSCTGKLPTLFHNHKWYSSGSV